MQSRTHHSWSTIIDGTAHPDPPIQKQVIRQMFTCNWEPFQMSHYALRKLILLLGNRKVHIKAILNISSDCLKETETPHYRHLVFNFLWTLTANFFKGKECMVQWKQLVLTLTVHLKKKKKRELSFQMGIKRQREIKFFKTSFFFFFSPPFRNSILDHQ